ncbi:MAG: hypothetical protein AAF334_00740 [Pseudomonadota bacterium]
MQLLIVLLVFLVAGLIWSSMRNRPRRPAPRRAERQNGAADVGLSSRGHPAERLDDPRLAATGVAVAIASMDGPISQEEIATLKAETARLFEIDERAALDLISDGRWLVAEFLTLDQAVSDLSAVVMRTAGADVQDDLLGMARAVAEAGSATLDPEQQAALDTVRQTFPPRS